MPRQKCAQCSLAEAACVCAYIERQYNAIPVLVLQHPDEGNKPLGTAKLIKLGLSACERLVSVSFDKPDVVETLRSMGVRSPLLLHHIYREELATDCGEDFQIDLASPDDVKKDLCAIEFDGLVLLDGTFRNVRELELANSWLSLWPRLVLCNAGPGRYRLRKSSVSDGLSSIEAVAEVLKRFDATFSSEAFLAPFERMIEFQIERMGLDTYHKNYAS